MEEEGQDQDEPEKADAEEEQAAGMSFAFKASDLFPGIGPGARNLALAVSDGRRTPLVDVTV